MALYRDFGHIISKVYWARKRLQRFSLLIIAISLGQGAFAIELSHHHPIAFQPLQILLIDEGVKDQHILTQGLGAGYYVEHIKSNEDPIAKLEELSLRYSGVSALHIVSHGEDGGIQLGNTLLTTDILHSSSTRLQTIAEMFSEDADLLVYGCDVAETRKGKGFVSSLATLMNVDVAASDDMTGAQVNDADWSLEYSIGQIDHTGPLIDFTHSQYQHTLAAFTENFSSGPTGGSAVTSFSVTHSSVQFDFTFHADNGGGDMIDEGTFGEANGASINVRSTLADTGTTERITIVRNDAADFTFISLYVNNTGGTTITR